MNLSVKKILIASFGFISIFFSACKKEEAEPVTVIEENKAPQHKWFCLSKNSIQPIDLPQNAPQVLEKPWTEALRISCMAQSPDNDSIAASREATPKVYALVNRLGILVFTDDSCSVFEDEKFFEGRSADKLVFMNETPIFSLYRNSFFNDTKTLSSAFKPFLVQFDSDSGVFYPILSYENLGFGKDEEITDFIWNGMDWYCSVKKTDSSSTEFSYIKWKPDTNLLTISPEENLITVLDSTEEEFREKRSPKDFAAAPTRIKGLLSSLPKDFNFYIRVKNAGGPSERIFFKGKQSEENPSVTAIGQLAENWAGVLFPDGTMYLNGILYGKKALNNGRTVALKLPKLPENYKYTDFGISGNYFYAAWEESNFYKTGRAGFLQVDFDKLLYKKQD